MIETMVEYHGVGLAAPQVHEGLRVFVGVLDAREEDSDDGRADRAHQPRDHAVGDDIVEDWEGCLSIPDIRGRVPRAREIKVRAFDRKGERIELAPHDFPARVIQHETDHLDGMLFFDRMRSFESLTFLDEYSRLLDEGLMTADNSCRHWRRPRHRPRDCAGVCRAGLRGRDRRADAPRARRHGGAIGARGAHARRRSPWTSPTKRAVAAGFAELRAVEPATWTCW